MNTDHLRDSDGDPDAYAIAAEFWGYDGPYNEYRTSAAATMIGQLVRYLNNATGKRSALPYASTAHNVLSGLSSAAFGLGQLTLQLRDFADRLIDDPSLYDDRSAASMRGLGDDASRTALDLITQLNAVLPVAADLAARLERAAGIASHLGHREPESGGE